MATTARKTRTGVVDALDLITTQHDEVDALFIQLESKSATGDTRQRLFDQLADNLAAHATMEEKVFYPAVRSKRTDDMLIESTEEHLQMKRMIADLLELPTDDERFDAKLKVLKEEVEHHAREEEEEKLFPIVRTLLSADELAALGNEMLALFEELIPTEPRKQVPNEIDRAASV